METKCREPTPKKPINYFKYYLRSSQNINIYMAHTPTLDDEKRRTNDRKTTRSPGCRRRKVRRMESRTKGSGGRKVGVPWFCNKIQGVNFQEFVFLGWFRMLVYDHGHGRGDDDDDDDHDHDHDHDAVVVVDDDDDEYEFTIGNTCHMAHTGFVDAVTIMMIMSANMFQRQRQKQRWERKKTLIFWMMIIQYTLLETNISPSNQHVWVDDFPAFPFGGICFLVPLKIPMTKSQEF